jgi:hypothetical protein
VQYGIVFISALSEVIGDDFETGTESPGVEVYGVLSANDPIPLVPPRGVRIAHDLAHALVEQQRLDGTEEWKN